jgi:DNA-binding beta-propeller fold protein YncE
LPVSATPAGSVFMIGPKPEGIAVDPVTGLVAVSLHAPDSVALTDRDGRLVRRVPLPAAPRHLRFAAPGGPLVAPAEAARRLVLVDVPGREIAAEVPVGRQPHDAVAIGSRYFVGNELSDSVSVIEGDRVVATLAAPQQPGGLAADGMLAVIGVRFRKLQLYDAVALQPLASAAAGVGPTHVVWAAHRLYVADTQGESVLVFSTQPRLEFIGRVPLAGAPYGLALDAQRKHLWVTLTASSTLVELDVSTPATRKLAMLPAVRQPNSVAVDPATGAVYVTGTAAGELQVIKPPAG